MRPWWLGAGVKLRCVQEPVQAGLFQSSQEEDLKSKEEQEVKTYHEYQSRTEVLLKEELSRVLQLPRSL